MVRDFSRIDTTPGATGKYAMFAPPQGFAGTNEDYFVWLRTRHDDLKIMSWYFRGPARCERLEVLGPYGEVFQIAFNKVRQRAESAI